MPQLQLLKTLWTENRGKLWLIFCLSGIFAAAQLWQGLWIEPKISDARTELRKLQGELRNARQQAAVGGGLKISGLSDDVKHFYQMVPPVSGLGSFIGRLYSYAETAGIDIKQITYAAKPVENARLQRYSLSFSVGGSYNQIKRFVHQLENSPSLLILDKISLGGTRQNEREVVNLQLKLQTFFKEEGA